MPALEAPFLFLTTRFVLGFFRPLGILALAFLFFGFFLGVVEAVRAPAQREVSPASSRMTMSCDIIQACQIIDASGLAVAGLLTSQGETCLVAPVELAKRRPVPAVSQPPSSLPWMSYLVSDMLLPALSVPVYRRGLRRARGR